MTFNVNYANTIIYKKYEEADATDNFWEGSERNGYFPVEPINTVQWLLMVTDINHITYDNAADLWARIQTYGKYCEHGGYEQITPADVLLCVGMSANCNENSLAAWVRRMSSSLKIDSTEFRSTHTKFKKQFNAQGHEVVFNISIVKTVKED